MAYYFRFGRVSLHVEPTCDVSTVYYVDSTRLSAAAAIISSVSFGGANDSKMQEENRRDNIMESPSQTASLRNYICMSMGDPPGKVNGKSKSGNPYSDHGAGIPVMDKVDVDALVDRCLKLLKESQNCNQSASNCKFNDYQQIFVGIAGTPGSGKSFIAEQIRDAINARNPNGDPNVQECVVVGMDGYHLSRQQLNEKAESGALFKTDQEDASGEPIRRQFTYDELMARRGAAFTYCPESFIRDLKHVKEHGEGSFPVYSREKHDPVPNGVSISKHNKVVLVEGLYLLCLHDPDWKPLEDLWDDKWYVDVSMEETKRRLVKRHLKTWNKEMMQQWGGDDEEAAARKAEANDLKNAACIQKNSRSNANLIIHNRTIPEDDDNNADVEAAVDSSKAIN